MTHKLIGVLAGVVALTFSAGAFAQPGSSDTTSQQPSSGNMGGSQDTSGSSSSTMGMGQQQLEGRVLKADSKNITVEYMGAAIPLEVSKNTLFQGVKSAKEIKEGQQVRASFELKNNKNQLTSVEVISGAGGSGAAGKSSKSKSSGSSGY